MKKIIYIFIIAFGFIANAQAKNNNQEGYHNHNGKQVLKSFSKNGGSKEGEAILTEFYKSVKEGRKDKNKDNIDKFKELRKNLNEVISAENFDIKAYNNLHKEINQLMATREKERNQAKEEFTVKLGQTLAKLSQKDREAFVKSFRGKNHKK